MQLLSAPHADIRVALFTVSDGRFWIAREDQGSYAGLPAGRTRYLVDRRIVDWALLWRRANLEYTTIFDRRRVLAADALELTGAIRRDGSHRPARLYRRRAAHNADASLTPAWAIHSDRETSNS